jgi:hypothetical protein
MFWQGMLGFNTKVVFWRIPVHELSIFHGRTLRAHISPVLAQNLIPVPPVILPTLHPFYRRSLLRGLYPNSIGGFLSHTGLFGNK